MCLLVVSKEEEVNAAMNHRHRPLFIALSTAVACSAALAILPNVLISSRQDLGSEEQVGDFVGTGFLLIAIVAGTMIFEAIVLRLFSSLTPMSSMATLSATAVSGHLGSTILTVLKNRDYHFNAGDEALFFVILYIPGLIISAVAYFAARRPHIPDH